MDPVYITIAEGDKNPAEIDGIASAAGAIQQAGSSALRSPSLAPLRSLQL